MGLLGLDSLVKAFEGEIMNQAVMQSNGRMVQPLWLAMLLCLAFVIGASGQTFAGAAFAEGASSTEPKKILVWGDSLSAAYGFDQKLGWPALLGERLTAEGFDYQVINGSVSGETTAGGLARFPRAIAAHKPSVVLLALGANDGLRALPTTAMKQQLGKMISLAETQGAQVLLFEMKIPPNYGPRYAQAFEAVYQDLVTETQAILVPFFLLDVVLKPELMQSDNLHPTAAAQPLLLQRVWAGLEGLLKR